MTTWRLPWFSSPASQESCHGERFLRFRPDRRTCSGERVNRVNQHDAMPRSVVRLGLLGLICATVLRLLLWIAEVRCWILNVLALMCCLYCFIGLNSLKVWKSGNPVSCYGHLSDFDVRFWSRISLPILYSNFILHIGNRFVQLLSIEPPVMNGFFCWKHFFLSQLTAGVKFPSFCTN